VEELVRNWAPLVWLAPGERYFPSSVPEFLRHVTPYRDGAQSTELPGGQSSETWYLVTKQSIGRSEILELVNLLVFACFTDCSKTSAREMRYLIGSTTTGSLIFIGSRSLTSLYNESLQITSYIKIFRLFQNVPIQP
jgi:hypothetical protein